jgi:hypothetical protein
MTSDRLGSSAVAAYLGIDPRTWSAYVARGQAPQADGIDEGFGRKYWLRSTIEEWKANRPGHGGRPSRKGQADG